MKEYPKKLTIVTIIIALAAICLSAVSLGTSLKSDKASDNTSDKDVQYVMYLGTNDKDTNDPVFAPDEAKEKAEEILVDRFGGYTIQEANGGWKGDDGTVYQEYTIVIYLSDTTSEEVHAAADDLIDAFHQSSVLIQANETSTEFYYGE